MQSVTGGRLVGSLPPREKGEKRRAMMRRLGGLCRPIVAACCSGGGTHPPASGGLLRVARTAASPRGGYVGRALATDGAEAGSQEATGGEFRFEILHESKKPGSRARVGRIHTPHGVIDTPGYVPVGTNGVVKSLDSRQLDEAGVQLMFCNTYHLLLHPGPDVVEAAGGLHRFMNRDRPIITDSGGFQVFSLMHDGVEFEGGREGEGRGDSGSDGEGERDGKKGKKEQPEGEIKQRKKNVRYKNEKMVLEVSEEGVLFKSYRDGKPLFLSPETSVGAQKKLGADIIIPLDELPPYTIDPGLLRESVDRSHRWMKRSLDAHLADPRGQAMYAVVHGGVSRELREHSADYLSGLPFDGYAVGGSVGKDRSELLEMLGWVMGRLPEGRPTHLLGVADDVSVGLCAPYGVDTFDSCYATKMARHGQLMTRQGRVKLKAGAVKREFRPPDEQCGCYTCRNFSLAYLHHLYKANEPTGTMLAVLHNVHYMNDLMADIRLKILNDEL